MMATNLQTTELRELSGLLPYVFADRKGRDLRSGFYEYRLLLSVAQGAVGALKNGDFKQFDALVGENNCETRAVWIALKADQLFRESGRLEMQLSGAQRKVDRLELSLEKAIGKPGMTLQKFLEDATVPLSRDEGLMIQCYLLFLTKASGEPKPETPLFSNEWTEPNGLLQYDKQGCFGSRLPPCLPKKVISICISYIDNSVSAQSARNLTSFSKKMVSRASVDFIQEQARGLQNAPLDQMVSSPQFIYDHSNFLRCAPMFWTYNVVLQTAENADIPIVMEARFEDQSSETLFFKPSPYRAVAPSPDDLMRISLVVQGIVCGDPDKEEWTRTMCARSIAIILAGAADHRQYPDVKEDHRVLALNDPEFESYRAMAVSEGYSDKNPTTFFIQHVYASQAGRIMRCVQRTLVFYTPRDMIHNLWF